MINYKEIPGQYPEDAARYAGGIGQVNKLVERLQRQGRLPERFRSSATTKAEVVSLEDLLRQQMYELLGRAVNPTEDEKKELREKRGLVFLPIATQSYVELVTANPKHYWSDERKYANARPELRDYRPPVAVEVGFRESELALPNSFWKPRYTALQMITGYSCNEIAADFPAFQAIGLPATGYASADEAYAQRNPGQALFKKYFVWCLDNLPEGNVANAGRYDPDEQFRVRGWLLLDDDGLDFFGGVPAVVKIGSK